jgi:hypothetical protein
VTRRRDYDYIRNDFQHGMVWGHAVARINKADARWWSRRKRWWKVGAPQDSVKIIARFKFRDQAEHLLEGLRSGESKYAYELIRIRMHRIDMADWLAGRNRYERNRVSNGR